MRKYIIGALCLLFSFPTMAQQMSPTDDLKGNVRMMRERTYIGMNENRKLKLRGAELYMYNEQILPIKKINYTSDTVIIGEVLYNYNNKNRLLEEVYLADSLIVGRMQYEYNSNDSLTSVRNIDRNGRVIYATTHAYDKNGNRIETVSGTDSIGTKQTFKYDKKGNRIATSFYSPDGIISEEWRYETDKNGNITESAKYDRNGQINSRLVYLYDNNKRKAEEYKYSYNNNSWITRTVYTYDKRGNVASKTVFQSDGKVSSKNTYQYNYDREGNWTEYREFKNGVIRFVKERMFLYSKLKENNKPQTEEIF